MEDLQVASAIIAENEISLQRRVNMLGQHLTNVGLENVKVALEVKVTIGNASGQHTRTISGEYSKFVVGNGGPNVRGSYGSPTVSSPSPTVPPQGFSSPGHTLPSAWNPGSANRP